MPRQLVIAAFWAPLGVPGKAQEVFDALRSCGIDESAGAVVSFREQTIDDSFRRFMRALDLAEVIDARPTSD